MVKFFVTFFFAIVGLLVSAADFTDPIFQDLKVTYPDSLQVRYVANSDSVIHRLSLANANGSVSVSIHLVVFPPNVKYDAKSEAKTQPESRLFNIEGYKTLYADSIDSRWARAYTYQLQINGQTYFCRTYRKATMIHGTPSMVMFKAFNKTDDFTFSDVIVSSVASSSFWNNHFSELLDKLWGLVLLLIPMLLGWLSTRLVADTKSMVIALSTLILSFIAVIIYCIYVYVTWWVFLIQFIFWICGIGNGITKASFWGKGGDNGGDDTGGDSTENYIKSDLGI